MTPKNKSESLQAIESGSGNAPTQEWPISPVAGKRPDVLNGSRWHMEQADCIEHMATLPEHSMDFSVFSPPFPSLFSYTDQEADIGNSDDLQNEAKLHLSFFYQQLQRVMRPGRVICVHVQQIAGLVRNGDYGLFDFRGMNIRLAQRAGLIYTYDWLVSKNPQAQAIRTHSHNLLFVTLERDRALSRGGLGDYLIKFIAPGENKVAIASPGISREEWIQWAEACWPWSDVRETDTLNTKEAKGEHDTKHICPLQLKVINRLVRLYTNPDEIVFSPFAGIGSEGYEALKLGRRFYGIELKDEYHQVALRNLAKAERHESERMSLFEFHK
jgi:hypothetical protein